MSSGMLSVGRDLSCRKSSKVIALVNAGHLSSCEFHLGVADKVRSLLVIIDIQRRAQRCNGRVVRAVHEDPQGIRVRFFRFLDHLGRKVGEEAAHA